MQHHVMLDRAITAFHCNYEIFYASKRRPRWYDYKNVMLYSLDGVWLYWVVLKYNPSKITHIWNKVIDLYITVVLRHKKLDYLFNSWFRLIAEKHPFGGSNSGRWIPLNEWNGKGFRLRTSPLTSHLFVQSIRSVRFFRFDLRGLALRLMISGIFRVFREITPCTSATFLIINPCLCFIYVSSRDKHTQTYLYV